MIRKHSTRLHTRNIHDDHRWKLIVNCAFVHTACVERGTLSPASENTANQSLARRKYSSVETVTLCSMKLPNFPTFHMQGTRGVESRVLIFSAPRARANDCGCVLSSWFAIAVVICGLQSRLRLRVAIEVEVRSMRGF